MAETGLPPHPGEYLIGLPRTGAGIRDDDTPPEAPAYSTLNGIVDYREHLRRTFAWGTTDNGVFGAKLMWNQVPELQALTSAIPEYRGLEPIDLLTRLFDDPAYVFVTRRDKVRQAVSLWKALQTRSWRAGGGRPPSELHYRYEGIKHLVDLFEADDEAWRAFFAEHRIRPPGDQLRGSPGARPGRRGAVRARADPGARARRLAGGSADEASGRRALGAVGGRLSSRQRAAGTTVAPSRGGRALRTR